MVHTRANVNCASHTRERKLVPSDFHPTATMTLLRCGRHHKPFAFALLLTLHHSAAYVVVESLTSPTIATQFSPTLLNFVTREMVAGAEAWVKIITPGPGVACSSVVGTEDAIAGGFCKLTFISDLSGTCVMMLSGKVQASNIVCYSETEVGSYDVLNPNPATLDLVPPISAAAVPLSVLSVSPTTLVQGEATLLTFVASALALAAGGEAFVKMVPAASNCTAASDATDAIAGGAAKLTFVTHSSATWIATVTEPPAFGSNAPLICFSAALGGPYADLASGVATIDVTPPLVIAVTQSSFPSNTAVTLDFATVGQTASVTFYIKIIAPGVACDAVDGATDALGGGSAAGALVFVSTTQGTLTLPALTLAPATDNVICYCIEHPYEALAGGAATIEITATATDAPSFTAMSPSSVAQLAPTTFTFTGANLVDDASMPYVKFISLLTGSCGGTLGVSDAIAGGVGRTVFVGPASATFTTTIKATSGVTPNAVCISATIDGMYASVMTGGSPNVLYITPPRAIVSCATGSVTQGADKAVLSLVAAVLVNSVALLPWIKIIASTGDCTAYASDVDAIGGGKGQVEFVGVSAARFTWGYVDTEPSAGLTVCYALSRTGDYVPLMGGADTLTITPAIPAVQSYIIGTVNQDAAATLVFATEFLVNDTTIPWLKVIVQGADCAAALGPSDAIGGGSGRLSFTSSTSAFFKWTNVGCVPGMYTFCYGPTQIGTYAALSTLPLATTTSLVVVGPIAGQPTVQSYIAIGPVVASSSASLSFVTANIADDATRPWVKFIAPGASCTSHVGGVDAIDGGIGQLSYFSSALGTMAWIPVTAAAASGYAVCWGSTRDGAFYPLTGGAATLDVVADTEGPTAVPSVAPSSAPTAASEVALTLRVCGVGTTPRTASAVKSVLIAGLGAPLRAVEITHQGALDTSSGCASIRATLRGFSAATASPAGLLAAVAMLFDSSAATNFGTLLRSESGAGATHTVIIAPHEVVHLMTWQPSATPTVAPTAAPSGTPSLAPTFLLTQTPSAAPSTSQPTEAPIAALTQSAGSDRGNGMFGSASALSAQEESALMLLIGGGGACCYCFCCCLLPALFLCSFRKKKKGKEAKDGEGDDSTAPRLNADVKPLSVDTGEEVAVDASGAAADGGEAKDGLEEGEVDDSEHSDDDIAMLLSMLGERGGKGGKGKADAAALAKTLTGAESKLLKKLTGGRFGSGSTRKKMVREMSKMMKGIKKIGHRDDGEEEHSDDDDDQYAFDEDGGDVEMAQMRGGGGGRRKSRRRSTGGGQQRRRSGGGGGGGGGGRRRRKSDSNVVESRSATRRHAQRRPSMPTSFDNAAWTGGGGGGGGGWGGQGPPAQQQQQWGMHPHQMQQHQQQQQQQPYGQHGGQMAPQHYGGQLPPSQQAAPWGGMNPMLQQQPGAVTLMSPRHAMPNPMSVMIPSSPTVVSMGGMNAHAMHAMITGGGSGGGGGGGAPPPTPRQRRMSANVVPAAL